METKTYIIDYITASGRKDFQTVRASSIEGAIRTFRQAGKSWMGTDFSSVEIIAVAIR